MTECTEYSSNQQICLLAYELRGEPFPDSQFPTYIVQVLVLVAVPGFKPNAFPFGKTRESTFSCRMKACWPCMLVSVLVCEKTTVGMSLGPYR